MEPIIDHIQITVKDLQAAERFYDQFLPIVGFDIRRKVSATIESHDFQVIEYTHEKLAFAITSPREFFKDETVNRRKPGALHHLAFKAETRAEVDLAYQKLLDMGAIIVAAPRLFPEYHANYYAVFFKDPDNIKFEIVCQSV